MIKFQTERNNIEPVSRQELLQASQEISERAVKKILDNFDQAGHEIKVLIDPMMVLSAIFPVK